MMTTPILTVAVSSRALFDFEEENKIYAADGEQAYMDTQQERLDSNVIAARGIAFPMVKKLLALNRADEQLVDVIVISRNDPVTGLRVFRAIGKYQLEISRGCFTRGSPSLPYLKAFNAHLFLSAFSEDVSEALANGFPAAHVFGRSTADNTDPKADATLRIAFDGDAVLVSDEAERVYQQEGLDTFQQQEDKLKTEPLSPGPFKPFLEALHQLQKRFPGKIRTALVTARGYPANERPIQTLRSWGVEVDEAFFLGGKTKQEVLDGFRPDFFFDDQLCHLPKERIAGGHVSSGVMNEQRDE